MRSSGGTSCQIGSPKSKVLVRIYDKAAERGLADGRHWVRVELQLRDKRAEEFLKIPMCIGKAFAGVLLNYLLFQMKPQFFIRLYRDSTDTSLIWYIYFLIAVLHHCTLQDIYDGRIGAEAQPKSCER